VDCPGSPQKGGFQRSFKNQQLGFAVHLLWKTEEEKSGERMEIKTAVPTHTHTHTPYVIKGGRGRTGEDAILIRKARIEERSLLGPVYNQVGRYPQ
jgi:hypothetical protein